MKGINQAELEKKLDLVIQKLMNLGGPEDEKELEAGGEKIGFFRRDFGIKEWDWPQGIGLYGLLKIMKVKKNQEYRDFLYHWFEDNIREGLPSKNINTTTPLLTLAEFNEECKNPEEAVPEVGRLADELPAPDERGRFPACDQCQRRSPGCPSQ